MKSLVSPIHPLRLCQGMRRFLVGAMCSAALAVLIYWTLLLGSPSESHLATAFWVGVAGSVVFYLCFLTLYVATRRLAEVQEELPFKWGRADERERSLRDHAYRRAYLILGFVWGTLLFWPLPFPDPAGYFWKVLAFFSIYGSLPTAVIAWLEPDLPAEEVSRASNA